jgi:hypothetical protein
MIIIILVSFIVAFLHHKDSEDLKIITYYLGVFVLQNFISIYSELIVNNILIEMFSENMFLATEFAIFSIYLYRVISSHKMRRIIKKFYWTFPALLLLELIKWPLYGPSGFAVVLKALYLIGPCLVYFYELFTTRRLVFLKNHPSFWIVTGILFYNSCTIPIFLTTNYFEKKAPLYGNIFFALNYILYGLLGLLFIRAYLCKKRVPAQ